jgi:transcription elongation factor Elf1
MPFPEVRGLGRRRRKKVKRVRRTRKITSLRYFQCPICGQPTLTIDFEKIKDKPGYKKAIVKCGSCGLYVELEVPEILDRIDVYNKVVDMAYEGKLEALTTEEAEETQAEEAPAGEAGELDKLLEEMAAEGAGESVGENPGEPQGEKEKL